jgi:type II secretory pathway pseudopilin PulG
MRAIQWPLATLACVGMVLSPSLRGVAAEPAAVAVQVAQAVATEPKVAAAVDLSYVPAAAVAALVVHPQQVLAGENAEWMPVEVITAAGLQHVGFDPTQIQEAIVVIAPPDTANQFKPEPIQHGDRAPPPRRRPTEPGFGAILHFAQAYSRRDVFAKLQPMAPQIKDLDGKKFAITRGPEPIGIYMPDDRTLVVGSDGLLQQMIVAKDVDSDLTKLLKSTDCSGTVTAVFSVDAMRDLVNQALAHAPPVPPPFADFLKIPNLISSGVIKLDFRNPGEFSATLHAPDAKSAEELQQLIERGIEMGRQYVSAQIAQESARAKDPVEQAALKYSSRMTGKMFDLLKPARDGSDVKWSTHGLAGPGGIAVIGILVALLLPAVSAAREAARRNMSMNNLKQIGLALLNYESAYSRFPARAIFSKEGKPLLSWRVQILPYLEESQLYKEFHLDESWDSPHNRPLIARMPAVLARPGDTDLTAGITHYVVPVGKGLMFDGDTGLRIAEVTDGTSNTIMAVEADKGVIWTKPDDLEVDLEKPLNGLGNLWPVGFMAVFGDCHVSVISASVDPSVLKALFTRAGGEPIDFSKLR